MNYPFKNLVLQGGGVKGIAYIGAIKELEKAGILGQIEAVAGTSIGALLSLLLSLRYSASEISDLLQQTDLSSFEDDWDPFRIVTEYGLYNGDTFLEWTKKLIAKKGLPEDATFEMLKEAGCRDLYVFDTDLNQRCAKTFSHESNPTTIVAEAVRAAMAIPLFFTAWRFTNSIPDDHLYVDGGMVFHHPLAFFDKKGCEPKDTLGLHLEDSTNQSKSHSLEYNEIYNYTSALFNTLVETQAAAFRKDSKALERTICINDCGWSATDFKMVKTQQLQLIDAGKKAAAAFLQNYPITATRISS